MYIDYNGREQEDQEMDNARQDRREARKEALRQAIRIHQRNQHFRTDNNYNAWSIEALERELDHLQREARWQRSLERSGQPFH